MIYPRVLILTNILIDNFSGGGITLSNLFKNWPKDKLAVISGNDKGFNYVFTKNYYRLGTKEDKWTFPFSLIKRSLHKISGAVSDICENDNRVSGSNSKDLLKNTFYNFINKVGLLEYFRYFKLSAELKDWIKAYNPDIIYAVFADLNTARLLKQIVRELNIPNVLHFMDDWPSTLYKNTLTPFARFEVLKHLKWLINNSAALFTISDAMSKEYEKRYKKKFFAFHNPIEIEELKSKSSWHTGEVIRVFYTGRIGNANQKNIYKMAKVIGEIISKALRIEFYLITPDYDSAELKRCCSSFKSTHIKHVVHHNEVNSILVSADMLFLPLDFDKNSESFAKYSMPTKTTEYMISGTPILVFAPMDNAVSIYAKEKEWGYVVDKDDENELTKAILELINNEEIRKRLGKKAIEVAKQNHDAEVVREKFRSELYIASKKNIGNNYVY
jgi:glycosyltransferase involved in cell wall biosynthesis